MLKANIRYVIVLSTIDDLQCTFKSPQSPGQSRRVGVVIMIFMRTMVLSQNISEIGMSIPCSASINPVLSLFRCQSFSGPILSSSHKIEHSDECYAKRCNRERCNLSLEVAPLRCRVLEDLSYDKSSTISHSHVDTDGSGSFVVACMAIQHQHVVETEHTLQKLALLELATVEVLT